MELNLKLTYAPHLNDENREHERELIAAVNDGVSHSVKMTTNKLQIERDRKDQRSISAIKGIKLIYRMARGGCLILMGNLSCSFRQPFGGEFFVTKSVFAKTLKKAEQVGRLVTLNVNYRSVAPVLNAYNIFYDRQLINMREKVKPQKVVFTDKFPIFNAKDIFFVDVKNGKEAKENTSRYNVEELRATAEILNDLMENTINPTTVSVSAIFPYAAQIEKFQRRYLDMINKAKKHFKSFEIDTVDAFQGRETDIVLVNTVVTDMSQRNFLNDFRRINVSMSRARDNLFSTRKTQLESRETI